MKRWVLFLLIMILAPAICVSAAQAQAGAVPSGLEGVWESSGKDFYLDFQTPGVVHLVETGYEEQDVVLPYEVGEGQLVLHYDDRTETLKCTVDRGIEMMLIWPNGMLTFLERTDAGAAGAEAATAARLAANAPTFPYQDAEETYLTERLAPLPRDYGSDIQMVEDASGAVYAVFIGGSGGISARVLRQGAWSEPEVVLIKKDLMYLHQFFLTLTSEGEPAVVCSIDDRYVLVRHSGGTWVEDSQPALTLKDSEMAGNFLWAGFWKGKLLLVNDTITSTGNPLCVNGKPLPHNPSTFGAQAGSSQDLEYVYFSLDKQGVLYMDSLVEGSAVDDVLNDTQRIIVYRCETSYSEDGGETWQGPVQVLSPLGAPTKRGSASLGQGRMIMIYDEWADSIKTGRLWLARVDRGNVSDVQNCLNIPELSAAGVTLMPNFREVGADGSGTLHFLAEYPDIDNYESRICHITRLGDGTWRVARTDISFYKVDHMLVLHDGRVMFCGRDGLDSYLAYTLQ